jgi:RNA polymerase sigma-70 factor (ECF subfamily)
LRSLGSRRRGETAATVEAASDPAPRTVDPATGYARRALRTNVASAMTALAPQQRQVVELAYFEGLSQSEIAARLNAPLGTVKSWTRQALLKLRERVPVEALP